MPWAPWSKDDQRRLERLRKSGHTVREIQEQHFPNVPLTSLYRYARAAPTHYRKPRRTRSGNERATTPRLDEAIAYLYTRGMNGPALARVLDLTPRIVQHRISADNLLAYRHEYQRKALQRCIADLTASGIDADAALARLDAEHEHEVNGRFKEDA